MPLIPKVKSKAKVKAKPISNSNPKPKYGEWLCGYCKEAHIEGKFSEDDTVYCYLCGELNVVKAMVKVAKPKEIKAKEPDPYDLDPRGNTFTQIGTGAPGGGIRWIIQDGHGKVRKDLMNGQDYL